ncbi:MAG: hypothetical protein CYPHOPRED_003229 [Cyphobasidiales sp. Tagirdzhanova-0007]|nr:MAG: hypothetical protein CYPHOPRED_003229 [Cyphobasidiales sp. Tagirdzhanova-0007]
MSLTTAVKIALQRLAPLELAENWDNVGLLLEPYLAPSISAQSRRKVLLATDLTTQVVDSMPEDVGSVVVYHPAIFRGLKSLTQADALQACILKCAAKGVSIYSPHTSLDAAKDGIQDWLARGLGDGSWQDHSKRPRVWILAQPAELDHIVKRVKHHLGMSTYTTGKKHIRSVGLCAGSGASFLEGSKADLWWTGEMSHHEVLATVAHGTHVVLCTHTATERPYLKSYFRAKLEETLNEVRTDENLNDAPYSVVMSEHEEEVLQFV